MRHSIRGWGIECDYDYNYERKGEGEGERYTPYAIRWQETLAPPNRFGYLHVTPVA